MSIVSHKITNIMPNQANSPTYFFIYPSINNSGSYAHSLGVKQGGAKVWQRTSDNSYLVTFGSMTSSSNIAGASFVYLIDHIMDGFVWSDYYTSPVPSFDNSESYFVYFPATLDSGVLTFDSCDLHYDQVASNWIPSSDDFTGVSANQVTKIINTCSLTVEDSGSGGTVNFDDSNIVSSILMIPATLLVLSFFICIYRIFVNRRTRG